MTPANSLKTFYEAVTVYDPILSGRISDNILEVALGALESDKSSAQPAADGLREQTRNLPLSLRNVLERALTDLGYS